MKMPSLTSSHQAVEFNLAMVKATSLHLSIILPSREEITGTFFRPTCGTKELQILCLQTITQDSQ
jgi:hypothetical protein